ncbi:unnamed protein product [Amoebophrya sp. A120]|nr:unnamed protein product [Amoebophrya sp. A120]|eukprot:GSA120T00005762001.1
MKRSSSSFSRPRPSAKSANFFRGSAFCQLLLQSQLVFFLSRLSFCVVVAEVAVRAEETTGNIIGKLQDRTTEVDFRDATAVGSTEKATEVVDFRDATAVDSTEKAREKIKWLRDQTKHCTAMLIGGDRRACGMIPEIDTVERYSELVLRSPRPYHLFILFTVRGCCNLRKGHCSRECGRAMESFQKVAASYHVLGEHNDKDDLGGPSSAADAGLGPPGAPASASSSGEQQAASAVASEKQDVFFAVVYCDSENSAMQEVCAFHKFEKVPKLVHARGSTLRRRNGTVSFRPQHVYAAVDWSNPNELLDFVKSFAPRPRLELYQDLFARLRKMAPLVGIGLAALLVLVLGAALVRWAPLLMVVGAVAVQWLGCSGLTYNLLHGMRWTGEAGEYIAKSNRSQYLGEGLGCSGLFMLGGLALVFAVQLARQPYATQTRAHLATFFAALAMLVGFAAVWNLMSIYATYKAGWYTAPGLFPPPEYKTGPVALDRGLSFVNTEAKAFYESSRTALAVGSFAQKWSAFFSSSYRSVLKKAKKQWNSSAIVATAHTIMIESFDLAWAPADWLMSAESSRGGAGGKKNKRKKK